MDICHEILHRHVESITDNSFLLLFWEAMFETNVGSVQAVFSVKQLFYTLLYIGK